MLRQSFYIPPELYRPIVLYLHQDRPSLLAVSLSSRILNAEGQRVLYKTMDISHDAQATHTLFLTTILSQGRLASLVEEYRQPHNILRSREDPFWDLLHRGLQAMVNLKKLFLEAPSHGRPSVEILRGCTFQLDLLQWYNASDLNEEEPQFLEFLASQTRLRSLSVRLKNVSTPIPASTCPTLEILHGDQGAMKAFLPERRIASLALTWMPSLDEPFDNTNFDSLSRSLKEVKFLSWGGFCDRPSLDLLCLHLENLEVLELVGLHDLTELLFLSELPSLKVLIISEMWQSWRSPMDMAGRGEYFPKLFSICKSLERIELYVKPQTYQRWIHDGTRVRSMPPHHVSEAILPGWNIG
ncbi:hypothetical protein M413DRAFT_23514 [Hebeloma cylindrosporum]|uniref:F-box domain-containing protein n=1 Tax=Hebeloma cylindrosporum TaxID=76867 RepID=A0A0C3CT80_HEBCY|nr:hypothetical protein M413DRAFT_23514 [Hebeloma cylindrosporum h7]